MPDTPRQTKPESSASDAPSAARTVSEVGAAWALSLAFDLLLHAGLLAGLYAQPSPFVLEPEQAFRRIPLGYTAFLILTAALRELLRRLAVRGARAGLVHGTAIGLVLWGATAAGLYSISTIRWQLAIGWWLGQAAELGLAGAVLGSAAGGTALARIWRRVGLAAVACAAVVVLLQSLGLAPPMKVVR